MSHLLQQSRDDSLNMQRLPMEEQHDKINSSQDPGGFASQDHQAGIGNRSQRKPAPSPLHTTSTDLSAQLGLVYTPSRTAFVSPPAGSQLRTTIATSILSPDSDKPRSPKERLDDLLASERSFYRSDDNRPDILSNSIDSRLESAINVPSGSARSVSDSLIISKSRPAAQSRPPTMASSTPRHLTDMAKGGKPRNSSIDSAISTMSTGTQSSKLSSDMADEDITKLIQAAGSSDAVIRYLLKEKHSLGAQNTQLWRLVDKQRAMILGLNKDLERALQEKERYRRKLKETLSSSSLNPAQPSASTENAIKSSDARPDSQQSSHVEALVSAGLRETVIHDELPPSPVDVALAPYPVTPPPTKTAAQTNVIRNMVEPEHVMPEATEHAHQRYNSESVSFKEESNKDVSSAGSLIQVQYNVSVPPSRTLPVDPPMPAKPVASHELYASQPARRGPPPPLNLHAQTTASSRMHDSDYSDDDESNYDNLLDVDEVPAIERGRRPTREADEQGREAARKALEPENLAKAAAEQTPDSGQASLLSDVKHADETSTTNNDMLAIPGAANAINSYKSSQPPMSPGLPLSPRPQFAQTLPRGSSLASPVLSSSGVFGGPPLSPRPPRQPIVLPPNAPPSGNAAEYPTRQQLDLRSPIPLNIQKKEKKVVDNTSDATSITVTEGSSIYRGFLTQEYPSLLLPPTSLASVEVRVASSRLKPSRASLLQPMKLDEDPVFTLAVLARSDGHELWRIEKDSVSLANLDQILKQSPMFRARTPDRSLFSGHAPAKIDARRVALDRYLEELLNTQFELQSAIELCRYLSTNVVEPNLDDVMLRSEARGEAVVLGPGGRPTKNGYLTKRGKNFGGWKARFFVLDGPILKYYEAPGGAHLGSIKLPKAEIGKQAQQVATNPEQEDVDNQYRHAFLIMEPKKKDSTSKVRHVLCAESDKERDQWVTTLLTYVNYVSEDDAEDVPSVVHSRKTSNDSSQIKKRVYGQGKVLGVAHVDEDKGLKSVGYHDTAPGKMPHSARSSPPPAQHERMPLQPTKPISAPKNATMISDSGAWGNKSSTLTPVPEDKRQRKRSFFGFGAKHHAPREVEHGSTSNLMQMSYENHGPIRPSFGAPLAEAVRYCHPANVDVELPAVVYRCIEYLDAKNAAGEEGIFRLSGSNIVIRQLRERFNTEGDINLVTDEQFYDIHAVASLLKLYLRELPTTILTRELHLDFLAVTELQDPHDKIRALNNLVHRLPPCNLSLLRCLASFLINIINHAEVNKMTVRNVGIVFSPTLNIPAPVFALFLQQYEGIFDEEPARGQSPVTDTASNAPYGQGNHHPSQQHNVMSSAYQQNISHLPHGPAGFNSMQQTLAGPEYGSKAPTIAGPAYDSGNNNQHDSTPSVKSTRRESSMFGISKQPSYSQMNSRIAEDDTLFE